MYALIVVEAENSYRLGKILNSTATSMPISDETESNEGSIQRQEVDLNACLRHSDVIVRNSLQNNREQYLHCVE